MSVQSSFRPGQLGFLAAIVAVVFCFCVSADARQGFPKKGRAPATKSYRPAQGGNSTGRKTTAIQNRGGRSSVSRSRGSNKNRYRGIQGTGHRNSISHFQGVYVPLSYGSRGFYGASSLNRFGYGYGNRGFSNSGFGFGGFTPYATYGNFLGSGVGVTVPVAPLNNGYGSSVAAEVLREHQLQQEISQDQQRYEIIDELARKNRELELLRLQMEIEQAKLAAVQNAGKQKVLKPVNDPAIDRLNEAAVVQCQEIARDSQLKAERAFRSGNYGQAARFAGVASSLDDQNGLVSLFASQAHFANGEYSDAVLKLDAAVQQLPPEEFGWVVSNFRLFYGRNDYVDQTRSLSAHLNANPNDADAWLLRGYQYGALGYPDAARKDLERARTLGSSTSLVDALSGRFVSPR